MPSSVVTQVLEIEDIRPHPDADRLELATLGGWQIVCGKGLYQNGERVVYVTPDTLITEKLADILEIKQHLQTVKNPDGTFVTNDKGETMLRVRQAKLRGEPSFGTTIPVDVMLEHYGIDINGTELGTNLADEIGVRKYEPAMRASAGDAEEDHPLFVKYTSIENIRNYPNVLEEGEEVVISEKIHGQNLRIGKIEGEYVAGSHGTRRKRPEVLSTNAFWYPLEYDSVKNLLDGLGESHKQVILFGESFGSVQKGYTYGIPNKVAFRAFDLLVDGKYLSHSDFIYLCEYYGVQTVPYYHNMKYDYNNIVQCAEAIPSSSLAEHGIEGIVIKPIQERYNHKVGRVIFKYITNSYLFNKNKSDYTEV